MTTTSSITKSLWIIWTPFIVMIRRPHVMGYSKVLWVFLPRKTTLHRLKHSSRLTFKTGKHVSLFFFFSNSLPMSIIMWPSLTKRGTKRQFGHAEWLTPTYSATKELQFDIRFQCVHNAKLKLRPLKVRWQYSGHFDKIELNGVTLL